MTVELRGSVVPEPTRIDVLHVLRAEELDRNGIPSQGRLKLTPVTVDSVQDDGTTVCSCHRCEFLVRRIEAGKIGICWELLIVFSAAESGRDWDSGADLNIGNVLPKPKEEASADSGLADGANVV